jgi:hypothetical protein
VRSHQSRPLAFRRGTAHLRENVVGSAVVALVAAVCAVADGREPYIDMNAFAGSREELESMTLR